MEVIYENGWKDLIDVWYYENQWLLPLNQDKALNGHID